MKKILFITLCLISLNACSKEGPVEKAGKAIDEVTDNVKEGENPLKKKGAAEKAGEAVDDAIDSAKD